MKVYERYEYHNFSYPEDMKLILEYLNERGEIKVKASTIEKLYYDFSDYVYCAGWMGVNDNVLEEFEEWLINVDL